MNSLFHLLPSFLKKRKKDKFVSVGITSYCKVFTGSCDHYIYLRNSYCPHKQTKICGMQIPFENSPWPALSSLRLTYQETSCFDEIIQICVLSQWEKKSSLQMPFCKKMDALNMMFTPLERTPHFDKWKYFFLQRTYCSHIS